MTAKSCHTCTHNRARHSGCDDCGAALDWAFWSEMLRPQKSLSQHLAMPDTAESPPGTPEWGAAHRETHRETHRQMEALRRRYPGYGTPEFRA